MKISLLLSLGTSLFWGGLFTLHAEQKWDLRPHWDPATHYRVETQTEEESKLPEPKSSGLKTAMNSVLSVTVDPENASGQKVVHFRVESLKAQVHAPSGEVQYDSADPAKAPPFYQQVFGAIANRAVEVLYGKDDQFQSVAPADATPTPPVGVTKGLSGAQLAEMFRKSFELGLPNQPVGPGDTWTTTDQADMGPILGTTQWKINATFDSLSEHNGVQYAKIVLSGQLTSEAPPASPSAPPLKISDGSSFKGELLYDLTHHVVSEANYTSEVKLAIEGKEASVTEKNQTRVLLTPAEKK